MGYAAIQHIVKETIRRIGMMDLPYEEEFRCQLKHLGFKEKEIVKETFLRQEWNIGSARVLKLLQETNILTASEFILTLECPDLTQQIMNDLLETEYTLLANVVQFADEGNQHSQKLKSILQDCFQCVVSDLKENPNVIPCNYLAFLKAHLQPDKMALVKRQHIELLLINQEPTMKLEEAVGQQERWRGEMEKLNDTIFGGLIIELTDDKEQLIGLLQRWIDDSISISLQHMLYLLSVTSKKIGTNKQEAGILKSFMKTLFRSTVETGVSSKMHLLFLFAREICTANEVILGTYSDWYKQTIGEMTYATKKDQFIRMMEMLTGMLSLETHVVTLNVHSTIAISAPAKCNDYVVNYKQLCRAHIAQLKPPDVTIIMEE